MTEHRDLEGASLHDPKGRYPTPLTLGSEATSYLIQDSDSNPLFQIDGVDGSIKVGNSVGKPVFKELSGTIEINADAAAAADEDPVLFLIGGDGVTAPSNDIVRTRLVQDSSGETLNLYVDRSRNGGGYATIATSLTIGKIGETTERQPSLTLSDGASGANKTWILAQAAGALGLSSGGGGTFTISNPVIINGTLQVINTANALQFGQPTIFFGSTSLPLPTLNLVQGSHGASQSFLELEELTTLSTGGVTTDTTIQVPAGAIFLGVTVRTQTGVVGASAYDVGVSGNTTKFASAVSGTLGASLACPIAPELNASAVSVRITANGTPSAGKVRVSLHYLTLTASGS